MPIDFPNSPSLNQTFTSGATTWIWTGTVWNTVTTAVGATGPTGPTGPVAGSANQIVYKNASNVAAGSNALTFDGTNFATTGAATAAAGLLSGSASFAGISFNGISNPTGQTGNPTLVVKSITSQTANLQEWHNSSGAALSSITASGELLIPKMALDQTADQIGLRVRAIAGQTNSLQQWQNPSGVALASIGPTGLLTANPAPATAATAASRVGYMGIPASGAGASGAYTLVEADAGELVYTTTSRTVTIPANASVPFEIGTTIVFISGTGATTTIAINSDTLLLAGQGTSGSRTLAAHGMATAVKVASTTWYISGNGLT